MTKGALFLDDEPLDIPSLYDPVEPEVEDPNFGALEWVFTPKSHPPQRDTLKGLIGQEGLALMEFAFDHGRLCALVGQMGPMAVQRLADEEATALSWWVADRISASDLALWRSFRLAATGGDSQGHARAAWAARHLSQSQPEPLWLDDIRDDLAAKHPEFNTLPDILRAGLLFYEALSGEDEPSPARQIETAVYAARLAAGAKATLGFVPLALTSVSAFRAGGPMEKRLNLWLRTAHQAVLAAILKLERIRAWQDRARLATKDLSGRTPRALIDCLLENPILSTVTASEACKVSRASAERNLALLEARGLTLEISGQDRFRIWTAKI